MFSKLIIVTGYTLLHLMLVINKITLHINFILSPFVIADAFLGLPCFYHFVHWDKTTIFFSNYEKKDFNNPISSVKYKQLNLNRYCGTRLLVRRSERTLLLHNIQGVPLQIKGFASPQLVGCP